MKIILILSTLLSTLAYARYDETLPKGVRLMAVRQVKTNKVTDFLNLNGQNESYGSDFHIDAKALSEIKEVNKYILEDLKQNSPEGYESLTAGSYDFQVEANVDVTGIGMGYGLTSNLTLYGALPYYQAQIDVKANRTKNNNYKEVNDLQGAKNSQGLVLDLESLPDADHGIVQSAIQNYYGYSPLGRWEGSGIGDIELGIKYRVLDWISGGALISTGLTLPSGREDNPDVIQDIGFGYGHWGAFLEAGVGQDYKRSTFNIRSRVDAFLPKTKNLRASSSNSDLKLEKNDYYVTPGLKLMINPYYEYALSKWWNLSSGIVHVQKFSDDYSSNNAYNDLILESVSHYSQTTLDLSVEFTTVKGYLSKEFAAPLSLNARMETTLQGTNTPDTTLYSLEARLYF